MTIATLLFALVALPPSQIPSPSPGQTGAGEPVMLDFTATWCGPCKQMRPAVEELIRKGYPVRPVDVDESPELAGKYNVSGVPAFVVVEPASGRVLARTEGYQPAASLAGLYNQARAKLAAARPAEPARHEAEADGGERDRDESAADVRPAAPSPNPRPWETVVRIKVHGPGADGYGSGTVIASNDEEALVLTCAHIFKLDGRAQAHPSKFPRRISVDLFDGVLRGQQVHFVRGETYPGEAVDYDFGRDVGLIRIRPGRRLPHAKVVPPHWAPRERMGMITVGCSEGHDATAWSTVVLNPAMRASVNGSGRYEAIECSSAPRQGRSGGGLFTSDGYVAGVCDFAEPRGNRGLYAAPSSIYAILDRNDLTALYRPASSPDSPRTQLAENARRPNPARRPTPLVARAQSPGRDDPGGVSLPPPEMVGITMPRLTASESGDEATSDSAARGVRKSWHATRTSELKMDPSVDPDPFAPAPSRLLDAPEPARAVQPEPATRTARKWRAVRSPLPDVAGGTVH